MKFLPIPLLLCLFVLQSAWGEVLVLHLGKHTIHAEIADTPLLRERGLMHRQQLCTDCGMLFVFERADRYSFWMKDTPQALSIAFISAAGNIININEMLPYTTSPHNAQGDALYALEMKQGWFASNGIKSGDHIPEISQHNKEADKLPPAKPGGLPY